MASGTERPTLKLISGGAPVATRFPALRAIRGTKGLGELASALEAIAQHALEHGPEAAASVAVKHLLAIDETRAMTAARATARKVASAR
jgi:hypothetical protein